jgi:hypothetical protein
MKIGDIMDVYYPDRGHDVGIIEKISAKRATVRLIGPNGETAILVPIARLHPKARTVGKLICSERRSSVHSWAPWLLVKPPHSVALGKAELANALHCLLARQCDLAPVAREVSAIPFHDLVKLGAKAFI